MKDSNNHDFIQINIFLTKWDNKMVKKTHININITIVLRHKHSNRDLLA